MLKQIKKWWSHALLLIISVAIIVISVIAEVYALTIVGVLLATAFVISIFFISYENGTILVKKCLLIMCVFAAFVLTIGVCVPIPV